MKRIFLSVLASLGLGLQAFGAIYVSDTYDSGFQNSGVIPDGDLNGLSDTRTISGTAGNWITGVNVTVNISAGYNGDLYAYLAHGSGMAVLLNRVGVGSSDPLGASGSGLTSLLLAAGNPNIHFNLGSGTTGTFAPDGRIIDPLSSPSAFDTASTGADFSTFNGLSPDGNWTLFFADAVDGGGSPTLVSWTLDITAIPEPVSVALAFFGMLIAGSIAGGYCAAARKAKRHCGAGHGWIRK